MVDLRSYRSKNRIMKLLFKSVIQLSKSNNILRQVTNVVLIKEKLPKSNKNKSNNVWYDVNCKNLYRQTLDTISESSTYRF